MKYDAVLEGGGMKIFGHVGAIAGLESRGFTPSHMAGTSAGAIVAACRVAGYKPAECLDILNKTDFTKMRDGSWLFIGRGLNLIRNFGFYKGDYLYGRIKEILSAKNVHTFGDLRSTESDPKFAWKFKCYATDITLKRLIEIPQALRPIYGVDPDEFDVALAVRCSSSIPLFFEPVKIKDSRLVDGGLVSNFPINTFDSAGPPEWPTFGLLLVEDTILSEPAEPSSIYSFLVSLIRTMAASHDKTLIQPQEYLQRTIRIPVGTVKATDFNISQNQKNILYQAGFNAATSFLSTWNWDVYKAWATTIRGKQNDSFNP